MSQTIRSHVTNHPVTCHKPSGHMSQTIRVTCHKPSGNMSQTIRVTCHKPYGSHVTNHTGHMSQTHRIPSRTHRIPSHPIASQHSLVYSLISTPMQLIHSFFSFLQPGNYVPRTPPHSVTCNSFIHFFHSYNISNERNSSE
jgi:hypothetical protein